MLLHQVTQIQIIELHTVNCKSCDYEIEMFEVEIRNSVQSVDFN